MKITNEDVQCSHYKRVTFPVPELVVQSYKYAVIEYCCYNDAVVKVLKSIQRCHS